MILKEYITEVLSNAARGAFPELEAEFCVEVTEATQEKFGDYQCNSPLKLAKVLKKSPKEIGEKIALHVGEEAIFEKIEVAAQGFINLTLASAFLAKHCRQTLQSPLLGYPAVHKKQKVVVDFSCPNIAKEMHVGHLRSTIIGDALARLFEFFGFEVLRLNHIGDWGTAFGMLIAYIRQEAPQMLEGADTDLPTLMQWYRASKKRFDEDEQFKQTARLSIVALQQGDKESLRIWEKICEISRNAYAQIYKLLDIKLIERGESFYNPLLAPMVEDLLKRGIAVVSEGATCIFIEGHEIPLMLQKSDGGYGYDTTDLAAMRHRVQVERADRIIIVTDSGQSLHFQLVSEGARKAGYLTPQVRFDHVPFGLVLAPTGKKFKTRSGETERLIDLITTAIEKARQILVEREVDLPIQELEHLAYVLGIDAIKYADLSTNRIQDYTFSYERMLRFEGNTAAFILYSYVRVQGIKRKVKNVDFHDLLENASITLEHPSERLLALHLLRFPETLQAMANDLMPHYLTDYLYQLAQRFNAFFRDCRVEGSEQQSSRLLLSELCARILRQGMELLGLQTVEKM